MHKRTVHHARADFELRRGQRLPVLLQEVKLWWQVPVSYHNLLKLVPPRRVGPDRNKQDAKCTVIFHFLNDLRQQRKRWIQPKSQRRPELTKSVQLFVPIPLEATVFRRRKGVQSRRKTSPLNNALNPFVWNDMGRPIQVRRNRLHVRNGNKRRRPFLDKVCRHQRRTRSRVLPFFSCETRHNSILLQGKNKTVLMRQNRHVMSTQEVVRQYCILGNICLIQPSTAVHWSTTRGTLARAAKGQLGCNTTLATRQTSATRCLKSPFSTSIFPYGGRYNICTHNRIHSASVDQTSPYTTLTVGKAHLCSDH